MGLPHARSPAKLIAVALAAVAVSGTGIAAATAQRPASGSHRSTEKFTWMLSSTTGVASVIATGKFVDGGTINPYAGGPYLTMKLGAGTIRLTSTTTRLYIKTNRATCLTTHSEHGSYKLIGGTGKYAGIRGSGRFTFTVRFVSHHKHGGGCATSRHPLAIQGIFTYSGSATLLR